MVKIVGTCGLWDHNIGLSIGGQSNLVELNGFRTNVMCAF